jgi:hypothetical protein
LRPTAQRITGILYPKITLYLGIQHVQGRKIGR